VRRYCIATSVAFGWLLTPLAEAHPLPISYLELRASAGGVEAVLRAPAIDFAHDLPEVTPDILLTVAGLENHKAALAGVVATRLLVTADGKTLTPILQAAEPVLDQMDVRLSLRFAWAAPPGDLQVRCRLFPYDPRHQTFLGIYWQGKLEHQAVFDEQTEVVGYQIGSRQGTFAIVRQFLAEGVHHIFIGPDHILFIIGLLLLGGSLLQLLKIVSAFTIAHSITLALATLDIFTPPARLIEPGIALSIVFVGVHSLLAGKGRHDLRLIFAFCFGLIHGFGFANVLGELELPRAALGWSLLSFNLGVEAGQACIVLIVAPLLAFLHRRSALASRRIVTAGSVSVVVAGAYWFVQRTFLFQ